MSKAENVIVADHSDGDSGMLTLWLTSRCSLKCAYCYAARVPPGDMTPETAKRAMDCMGDIPFKLQLAGGEPTLADEGIFAAVCEYAQGKASRISIQTNATALSDAMIRLIQKYSIAVGVSLDGPPKVNDALRGSTRRVLEGIQRLGDAGIAVNINAVVTSENVEELYRLPDLAVYLGNVRGIGFDLMRKAGRALNENAPEPPAPENVRKMLRDVYKRTEALNKFVKTPIHIREIQETRIRLERRVSCESYCYASLGRSFVVLPDGAVYPCGSLALEPEYFMGNIREGIHAIRIPPMPRENCAGCRYEAVCPGGCPARALQYGGFSPQDCALRIEAFRIAEEETARKIEPASAREEIGHACLS